MNKMDSSVALANLRSQWDGKSISQGTYLRRKRFLQRCINKEKKKRAWARKGLKRKIRVYKLDLKELHGSNVKDTRAIARKTFAIMDKETALKGLTRRCMVDMKTLNKMRKII